MIGDSARAGFGQRLGQFRFEQIKIAGFSGADPNASVARRRKGHPHEDISRHKSVKHGGGETRVILPGSGTAEGTRAGGTKWFGRAAVAEACLAFAKKLMGRGTTESPDAGSE